MILDMQYSHCAKPSKMAIHNVCLESFNTLFTTSTTWQCNLLAALAKHERHRACKGSPPYLSHDTQSGSHKEHATMIGLHAWPVIWPKWHHERQTCVNRGSVYTHPPLLCFIATRALSLPKEAE